MYGLQAVAEQEGLKLRVRMQVEIGK